MTWTRAGRFCPQMSVPLDQSRSSTSISHFPDAGHAHSTGGIPALGKAPTGRPSSVFPFCKHQFVYLPLPRFFIVGGHPLISKGHSLCP